MPAMTTGNRAYQAIERKTRRRQLRRAGKGRAGKARRRSVKDKIASLRAKGLIAAGRR